jgi:hypothetical protein
MAWGFTQPGEEPNKGGRPLGNITRYKPVYAMHANAAQMPEFVKTAKDLMSTYGSSSLPSGLQPRWMRNKTNLNISKGMTKGK